MIATLRFYGELQELLSAERPGREYGLEFPERRSVKDLIESEGVPHTEVGLILVNDRSVDFDCQVGFGERVAVYPHFTHLPAQPASAITRPELPELAFLADVHLGKLARRLRLLGCDCAYGPDFEDAQLAEQSARQSRILLTRDRGLLMRSIVVHGIFIRSGDVRHQLQQVLRRTGLNPRAPRPPRCLTCNGTLTPVEPEGVRHRIPAYTYQHMGPFLQCRDCGKVFWKGTHWPKLRGFLDDSADD